MNENTSNLFKSGIVIDERIDIRTTAKDVLKEVGIDSLAFDSIKDVLNHLKSEHPPPDWILTCLQTSDHSNAFQLLSFVLQTKKFRKTRVSFLAFQEEVLYLPVAFEMGLLSYHFKPFTKAELLEEVQELLSGLTSDYTQHCFLAAKYLRKHLSLLEDSKPLLSLEEKLVNFFPDRPECFVKLAEAHYHAGETEKAKAILASSDFRKHGISIEIPELEELVASGGDQEKERSNFSTAYGVETVMAVDADEAIHRQITKTLNELGVKQVHCFVDGEQAFAWLKEHQQLSMIIMEWRIPKISGLALLQRIRHLGINVPIVIISSLLSEEYTPLLSEMGVTGTIEKPIENEQFVLNLMKMLRHDRYPTLYTDLERKFRTALASGKTDEVQSLYLRLQADEQTPPNLLKALGAEAAYIKGELEEAKKLAFEAFRMDSKEISILNTLGKILLATGERESALKCFEKVQKFSVENLHRLCLLAEVNAELQNFEASDTYLTKAKTIDKSNPEVTETDVKVSLSRGDVDKAASSMKVLESFSNIVSYMNNRAVALSKTGQLEEGIQLYHNTLEALPSDNVSDRSKVSYNLALAYARSQNLDKAEAQLINLVHRGEKSGLKEKSLSLLNRLQTAKKTGRELVLQVSDKAVKVQTLDILRPMALDAAPGELCLHLIYNAGSELPSEVIEKLKAAKLG